MSLSIGEPGDGVIDSIAKLIPGEVVFVHTIVLSTGSITRPAAALALVASGILVSAVVLYLASRRRPAPLGQYLIRAAAYVSWAVTIDNVLLGLDARWIPALAVGAVPVLGALLFPPAAPLAAPREVAS